MIIQEAILKDVEKLALLERRCFDSFFLTLPQLKHLVKTPSAMVIVAYEQEELLGGATVLFRKNSKKARIYSLVVAPEQRGRGLAKAIMAFVEEASFKRDCKEIFLEVRKDNIKAVNFYLKKGFEIFAEYPAYYEDGEDALRMRKGLK